MLTDLIAGFALDCKRYTASAAALRLVRASRILAMPQVRRRLLANPAFSAHVNSAGHGDPLFFLACRHFVVQGLTREQRARVVLCHYGHEASAFQGRYLDAVYREGGLTLWQHTVEDQHYDLRLMPGNDVLYEGGLSLVFLINGGRVCVVSFSIVPTDLFAPAVAAGGAKSVMFVARKQLTETREYQKAFNKAFDRTTPAHLVFGGLAGLALAQGQRSFIGTKVDVQPSFSEAMRERFKTAYTDFWESLDGRPESPYGYIIDLPLTMTPLDHLDAAKRKRALARRAHIERVRDSAFATIRPLLSNQGAPSM